MEYVNKGLAAFFQPFLRRTFDLFLGEFVDQNGIDIKDLTLNGLDNLKLDVQKINEKYFQNSHFLMERCEIFSLKIYFSLSKKIQIIIDKIDLGLYVNEDIQQDCKNDEKHCKKNFNKKDSNVELNVENNQKIIETWQNYSIELKIKEIQLSIKPTRPTVEADYFLFAIKDINLIKNPNKNLETKNKQQFLINLKIQDISIWMQKKKNLDISMVNQQAQKLRHQIFHLSEPLKLDFQIKTQENEFEIILNGSIKEILFILNYQVLSLLAIFYSKVINFEQSKLIFHQNWEILDSITQSHAAYIADKFVNKFDEKFEQILQSFDLKFSQNFGQDNFNFQKANQIQQRKIFAKINIGRILFVLYDDKEFNNLDLEIKTNYIEETFLNIFPFENYQCCFKEIEFVFKKNSLISFFKNIRVSHLQRAENKKQKTFIKKNLNNSSALMQSMLDISYEVNDILDFNYTNFDNQDKALQEDFVFLQEFQKSRKNSQEFLQQSEKQFDYAIIIKIQNKTCYSVVKHVRMTLDNLLIFIDQFVSKFQIQLEEQISNCHISSNFLKDFDLQVYYKQFSKLNQKKILENLKKKFQKIKSKEVLIFDLPFNLMFGLNNFSIKLNADSTQKLLQLDNLSLKFCDLKAQSKTKEYGFLNFDSLQIFDSLRISETKLSLKNFDTSKLTCEILMEAKLLLGLINLETIRQLKKDIEQIFTLNRISLQNFFKKIQNFKEIQDDLISVFENIQNKIIMNQLLNEIGLELLPKWKLYSQFLFNLKNINFKIIDSDYKALQNLNDFLFQEDENQKIFHELDYSSNSGKRYEEVVLLDLNTESLLFEINQDYQKIQIKNFQAHMFDIWVNQDQEYFLDINFDNLILKSLPQVFQIQLNAIKVNFDSTQKRLHLIRKYLEQKSQLIDLNFISNLNKKQVNTQQNQKQIQLKLNSVEINLQELLLNLKISLQNIHIKNDILSVPFIQTSKVNIAMQSEQQLLQIYGLNFNLIENDLKIKNFNLLLTFNILKLFQEFSNYLSFNLLQFDKIFNQEIKNKLKLQKSTSEQSKDNFQSFISQQPSNENYQSDFEIIGKKWDTFMQFKNTVQNRGGLLDPQEALQEFIIAQNQKEHQKWQLMINEIKIQITDDTVESDYIINLYKICCIQTKQLIGVLNNFEFLIKKQFNQDLIFTNQKNNFTLRFYLDQNSNNNFFIGLSNLIFQGKKKLWETLDDRLKLFLEDFYQQQKQVISQQENFEMINSEIEDILEEAFIDSFQIILKLAKQEIVLNIEETNSMEIFKEDKYVDDFINLFVEKIFKSIKKSCFSLSVLSGFKIILFFLWRIFTFVFLRKNLMNVNKSFFKIFKQKMTNLIKKQIIQSL